MVAVGEAMGWEMKTPEQREAERRALLARVYAGRDRELEAQVVDPPAWLTDKVPRKPRPAQRLDKCAHCGVAFTLPRSTSIDAIDRAGLFCTLRCAARYGTRAAELRLLL